MLRYQWPYDPAAYPYPTNMERVQVYGYVKYFFNVNEMKEKQEYWSF